MIKPDLYDEFERTRDQWLPREDCAENIAFDRRKPGLFKEEWSGDGCIALNSKSYICFGGDIAKRHETTKYSAKGVSIKNSLDKDMYDLVLKTGVSKAFYNRGFITKDGKMLSYEMLKNGLSYFYGKRKVLKDGKSTMPLDL